MSSVVLWGALWGAPVTMTPGLRPDRVCRVLGSGESQAAPHNTGLGSNSAGNTARFIPLLDPRDAL